MKKTFRHWARRAAWMPVALGLAAIGAAPARADDGASSLRGYWPLDEGSGQIAHDASGNANNGQLGSTPGPDAADPSWVAGRFGAALGFHGDDYIQIPVSPTLETPPTLTVATYFRGDRSPGEWRYLVSKGSRGCNAASYGLYSGRNGGLGFYIATKVGFVVSPLAGQEVWNGAWHHATGTYDGQTVRLFVDGQEVAHGTPTTAEIAYGLPGGNAYLGAYRGHCDLMLTGELDDVAIWGRALTAREVSSVARAGPLAVSPTVTPSSPVGRPRAECRKRKGSRRRCRLRVSFVVHRPVRLRIELAKLRGRKARKVGALNVAVGPPRGSVLLPSRLGGHPVDRGRYRVTLLELQRGGTRPVGSAIGHVR